MSDQSFDEIKACLRDEPTAGKHLGNYKGDHYGMEYFKKGIITHLTQNNSEHISFQFWGWELVLCNDGTFFINDTSGG